MKKRNHNFLHKLLTLRFASPINLFSYTAKTEKGAFLQVINDIKYYLGLGYIQEVPVNKPKTHSKNIDRSIKDWSTFYCLTLKGAIVIGREEEYRQSVIKSLNNLEHESMKQDIKRSFLENYPDYDFDFNDHANLSGIRPDILVKAKNLQTRKEFTFLIEIEHKKEMSRTHREKVLKYETVLSKGFFSKNNLSPKTKILIVFCNFRFNGFYRPLYFNKPEYKPIMDSLYKSFDEYIASNKKITKGVYRFIPFPEFMNLGQPICRTDNGTKVKLIDNIAN